MSRFRLFVLAMASFLAVVGESFFKKSIAVGLCGILTFNSASCWGSGVSAAIANQGDLSVDSTEISQSEYEPPGIRRAPVDLQDALADDFGIVSQNPFSSGRNEILFTSPSTGVEQKYSVNLPGTGNFQLFEVEFNKVSVPNPEKLVGEGNTIFTADQIANLLQSFRINFQNNQPSEVIFADGSKAEFSNSSYVFKLPSGEVVDSVTLSQGNLPDGNNVVSKASIINSKYGNYNYLAQSGNACQGTVRTKLNSLSKDMIGLGDKLKSSDASTKELARWVLAFGGQSLEDSTVTGSRNITMDEVACRKPVECGQVQDYDGGSEIRTDLFHLQSGTNRTVNLDYEFYQIPDRLEIYYNGEIRYAIPEPTQTLTNTTNPPQGFLASGNGRRSIPIDDGVEYVGVKLIGNADQGTKWTYQISCTGEAIADAGPQCSTDNSVSSLPSNIKSTFSNLIKQNNKGSNNNTYPQIIENLFIADAPEPNLSEHDKKELVEKYSPILYFDKGEIGENKPENYPMPFSVEETWSNYQPKIRGDSTESIDLSRYGDRVNPPYCGKSKIYASISDKGGKLAINYYFHYPRSNWKFYNGFNTHQGDWEGVTVFLDEQKKPVKVAFSQHIKTVEGIVSDGGMTVLWELLDHPKDDDNKFNVYVGLGAHASFPFRGITKFRGFGKVKQLEFGDVELHKGDLTRLCGNSTDVELLPHVGNINPEGDDYNNYAWLLFPGKWGKSEDNGWGDDPPSGLLFLDSGSFNLDFKDDQGFGLKWLNPWNWSSSFPELKLGRNNFNRVDQIIDLGDSKNNILIADESRSILRGGGGNDIYHCKVYLRSSFVEDTDGNDTLKLFKKEAYTVPLYHCTDTTCEEIRYRDVEIGINSAKKISQGVMGLEKDGNNLIIDVNKDGIASYLRDVIIVDFFDDSGTREGKGFIEKVAQVDGQAILKLFQ